MKWSGRGDSAFTDAVSAQYERYLVPLIFEPYAPIMKPRPGHHQVRVIGIALAGLTKDLPRSPRIFLVPESGDIEQWNRRPLDLCVPRLALVERIVVRMGDDRVPRRNGIMEVFRVDVRQRTELQIPLVRVVRIEVEMSVLELVRLLIHRVLERVTLA